MEGGDQCLLDGILDSLEDIGYTGSLLEDGHLKLAIEGGLGDVSFINLIMSLCSELKSLLCMQEAITRPLGPEDSESFSLEMRAFLQELQCPHSLLTTSTDTCLATYSTRLLLVDYLLSELLAARLSTARGDNEATPTSQTPPYSVPGNLVAILKVFGLSAPPPNVTVFQVFDKIIAKTRESVSTTVIEPGLVTQPLSDAQWSTLDRINDSLAKEYTIRRRMLLTRCDVTAQSFRWSDKTKGKGEEFERVYQTLRSCLSASASVSIARVLAAKKDLLTVHRTSSGESRQACAINKVLIGKVPDRGGRPRETRPPPEMPAFKRRTDPPPQERRDGGYKGDKRGSRGGRVQGGWSAGQRRGGRGGWQRGGSHGNQHHGAKGGGGKMYYS